MSKKESLTEQTIKGSFWNTLFALTQRVGGVIFTIILARLLLPEKFGLYNLVLSIALIFMTFSYEGINQGIIRYISESINKKKKAAAYFKYIRNLKITVSLIVSVILALLSYPLAYYIFEKPVIFVPLLFAACYIFVLSIEGLYNSLFFAIKRVEYSVYREAIYQISRVLIIILMFFVIGLSPEVEYVILALTISAILTFGLIFIKAKGIAKPIFQKSNTLELKEKSRILKFIFYSTAGSISFIFFGYIDTIMLGLLVNDASSIGFYRAAFVLASSIGGLLTFSWVLIPIFMQIKKQKLQDAFNRVLKYSLVMAVPAAFGLAALGNYFLVLLYGYDYLSATLPLYFLSALVFVGVIVSLLLSLFSVKEKPQEYLPLLAITTIINIILNYILILWLSNYSLVWAISGAAIATIASWTFYCALLYYKVKKVLKIKADLTTIIKPMIASVIMIIVVYLARAFFGDANLIKGIALVAIGIIAYSIALYLIKGVSKEDISLISQLVKSKIQPKK